MNIYIKLFGRYREYSNKREFQIELEDGQRVIDLIQTLKIPDVDLWVLVNGAPESKERILKDGDMVALLEPVAGG